MVAQSQVSLHSKTIVRNVAKSGITTNDEGSFLVSSSPSGSHSVTFTNKITGKAHTYDISSISENSFHAA
jgi:hypothetical protein